MHSTRTDPSTGGATDTAKERVSNVASTAGEEAREVARDASTHARELVGETRQQLRSQADEQTERVSGSLRQISQQLRGMGEGRAAPSGMVSDLTRQLAGVTESFASKLETGGLDSALDDVKRFARNRPGMFIALAAGTGFMVGRLLRAVDTKSVIDAAKDAVNADGGDQSTLSSPGSYGATTAVGGTAPIGAVGSTSTPQTGDLPGIGA